MSLFQKETPEQKAAREAAEAHDAASRAALERGGLPIRAQDRLAQERRADGRPKLWTSVLSVSELLTSRSVGFEPISQVFGSSVYRMAYAVGQWTYSSSMEITNFSQSLYDARELAMERMQAEATGLGAEGIVGAQIHEKSHGWGSHVIEYFAVGTAVIQTRADHIIQPPQLVLTLDD